MHRIRSILGIGMLVSLIAIGPALAQDPDDGGGGARPADEPDDLVVPAATWTSRQSKKGLGAMVTIPYPPALIERILVDHEIRSGSTDATAGLRKLILLPGGGVSLGCNHRIVRRGDGVGIERTAAVKPSPSGATGLEGSYGWEVVAPTITPTDTGYEYRFRLRLTIHEKFRYDVLVRATLTSPESLEGDATSRFVVEWEGPVAPE